MVALALLGLRADPAFADETAASAPVVASCRVEVRGGGKEAPEHYAAELARRIRSSLGGAPTIEPAPCEVVVDLDPLPDASVPDFPTVEATCQATIMVSAVGPAKSRRCTRYLPTSCARALEGPIVATASYFLVTRWSDDAPPQAPGRRLGSPLPSPESRLDAHELLAPARRALTECDPGRALAAIAQIRRTTQDRDSLWALAPLEREARLSLGDEAGAHVADEQARASAKPEGGSRSHGLDLGFGLRAETEAPGHAMVSARYTATFGTPRVQLGPYAEALATRAFTSSSAPALGAGIALRLRGASGGAVGELASGPYVSTTSGYAGIGGSLFVGVDPVGDWGHIGVFVDVRSGPLGEAAEESNPFVLTGIRFDLGLPFNALAAGLYALLR
jgi:hypothetical protein